MVKGFLNLPWFLWAGTALVIAILYSIYWPSKVLTEAAGLRFFVIRWGHALTWLLLTINFILRGIDPKFNGAANIIAGAGGVIYLLFIATTFIVK